jgi:hypothetical protein
MVPKETEATIVRLYHAEHWKVGTIARQLKVHHETVRQVTGFGTLVRAASGCRRSRKGTAQF